MIFYAIKILEDVSDNLDWLHPSERRVFDLLSIEKRRQDWLLGRWTAKNLVKNAWRPDIDLRELEIRNNTNRAPFIYFEDKALPLSISISHGHDMAFSATAAGNIKIGCDLESIEKRSQHFLDDYFMSEEHLSASDHALERDCFYSVCWSVKESVMKAERLGMSLHPKKILVEHVDEGRGEWAGVKASIPGQKKKYYGLWKRMGDLVFVLLSDRENFSYNPK
jgi:4'-phosphopantetheinyl transferase